MKYREFDRRARLLARRRWTDRERRVVWRGLTGRFALAIEPLLGVIVMTALAFGIVWRAQHVPEDATLIKISPFFGVTALAFFAWFVALLVAPFRAYLQTYGPIYVLDGYVRYREPDERSEDDARGYVAALFADRSVACEWEWLGTPRLPNVTIPALIEFSTFAGIHRIDGRSTGLLPDEDLPLLAIGIAARRGLREDL
ncbi:MAG TPA: hypothetical protein VMF61_14655 [Candidatus Acidoferrales bacterium]|nr:hypothetical protein [Candidatus Acidoferrales bacterium]